MTVRNAMDGGEAIVEAFRNLGVDYVMSSPGSEWGSLWEALARQQVEGKDGPEYLSCWHETLAVNLAAGYTAVTGRMQAVVLHAGVGLLQGSIGIHGAQQAEYPMLVLSGESLTYGDQAGFDPGAQWVQSLSVVGGPNRFIDPLVKFGQQATSPATLYETIVRAGELAQQAPAGPTYVNVPIETMLQPWTPPALLRKALPPGRPRPSDADIEQVARLLVTARSPAVTTENIGRDPDGMAALLDLAELLGMPVVEGAVADYVNFPKDHPLHQGFKFDPLRDEVDVVLLVRTRVPWYPPGNRPTAATTIALDESPYKPFMVYQNLQADRVLTGDAVASLRLLADRVRALGVDAKLVAERRARFAARHKARMDALQAERDKTAATGPIDPLRFCEIMNRIVPDNAIYVDETITHRRMFQPHLMWRRPQGYFRAPSGLGQGIGMALGVKLAKPKNPVIAMLGDGSFLYNPVTQGLAYSMEAGLPVLFIVCNNRGYVAMKNNQLSYYPDGVGKRHGVYLGEPIKAPDYGELVRPFGGYGRKAETVEEIEPAFRDCLAAVEGGRTAVLNLVLTR
ncbi:MAG: thiamine pyrophosphate-binding protein [Alphaproteobacteria bacterium]|nr:thiamine pyrophosphate-binding protein [Alphaproteobacteria bacterium]